MEFRSVTVCRTSPRASGCVGAACSRRRAPSTVLCARTAVAPLSKPTTVAGPTSFVPSGFPKSVSPIRSVLSRFFLMRLLNNAFSCPNFISISCFTLPILPTSIPHLKANLRLRKTNFPDMITKWKTSALKVLYF